jgi:hypothetical protein
LRFLCMSQNFSVPWEQGSSFLEMLRRAILYQLKGPLLNLNFLSV